MLGSLSELAFLIQISYKHARTHLINQDIQHLLAPVCDASFNPHGGDMNYEILVDTRVSHTSCIDYVCEICFVLNTLKCFFRFWLWILWRQRRHLSSFQTPKFGHSEKLFNRLFRILTWTSSPLRTYAVLQTCQRVYTCHVVLAERWETSTDADHPRVSLNFSTWVPNINTSILLLKSFLFYRLDDRFKFRLS
jgi:hypothetical protein